MELDFDLLFGESEGGTTKWYCWNKKEYKCYLVIFTKDDTDIHAKIREVPEEIVEHYIMNNFTSIKNEIERQGGI